MPNTLTERVGLSLGRHFVSLSCMQFVPGKPDKPLVFSGFVMAIGNDWFYVTAGHILRAVRAALEGGSTFDIWRLGDQTAARGKFDHTAIPFDFNIENWLVIEDEALGIDYAAVHLGMLYRLQLEAGSVEAFEKETWGDHMVASDHWALVGIPSESVSYDGKTNIGARFVLAPLIKADTPEHAGERAENQFYARLAEDHEGVVKNIDGMSGGPVINLKQVDNVEWRYQLIGVQSAWYPSTRTLAICPFSSFAVALEQAVRKPCPS